MVEKFRIALTSSVVQATELCKSAGIFAETHGKYHVGLVAAKDLWFLRRPELGAQGAPRCRDRCLCNVLSRLCFRVSRDVDDYLFAFQM